MLWGHGRRASGQSQGHVNSLFAIQVLLALTPINVLVWCVVHYEYCYLFLGAIMGSLLGYFPFMMLSSTRTPLGVSLFILSVLMWSGNIALIFFNPETFAVHLAN